MILDVLSFNGISKTVDLISMKFGGNLVTDKCLVFGVAHMS